jgi:PhnB protein
MHAHLKIGDADVMASDTFDLKYEKPIGFYVAINVDSPSEAERIFNALTPGGTVQQALQETFFAYKFGTVVDKWGTPWMVVSQKPMGG